MSYEVEQLSNNARTTLDGGIDGSVTSLDLASASLFPTSGVFRIIIGSEILKVTAISGTTCTVERGSEGSTPASHSSGDAVTQILTAASMQALLVDAIGHPLYTHPRLADFAHVNQGGATADDDNRGIYYESPASGGSDTIRLMKQAAPSTPYVLTTKILPIFQAADVFFFAGILFRENATGKLMTLNLTQFSGPSARMKCERWNSPTSFSAEVAALASPFTAYIYTPWLRLRDDGTSIYFDWSVDGYKFINLRTETRGSFFTTAPDEIGFYVNANHATIAGGVRILSWAKT